MKCYCCHLSLCVIMRCNHLEKKNTSLNCQSLSSSPLFLSLLLLYLRHKHTSSLLWHRLRVYLTLSFDRLAILYVLHFCFCSILSEFNIICLCDLLYDPSSRFKIHIWVYALIIRERGKKLPLNFMLFGL